MRMFVTILTSLFLLSLSACSTVPAPAPKPVVKIVKAVPPSSLLELCKKPDPRAIRNNRDLVESRQDWITQFGFCAKKIERLRQWYDQPTENVQQPQPEVGARVGPLPDQNTGS